MTSKTLYKLSGVSGIISAVLLLILGIGILVPTLQGELVSIIQNIVMRSSAGIAHIFFTFVLIGIYFIQYKKLGWLGLAGFIISMLANALFTATQTISSFVSVNLHPIVETLTGPALIVGLLLLAIANHQSGILPKWAFWLMFLGHTVNRYIRPLLDQIFGIPEVSVPPTVQILLFAGGITWLSIVLLRSENIAFSSEEKSDGNREVTLKTLIRLAGIFAILGAVFNLTLGIGELFVESHTSPAYSVLSLIAGFAHIFLMFAFTALYLSGYQKLGWAGMVGFFLAITANSLFTLGQLITAYYGQLTGFPGFLTGPLFIIGLLLLAWANHKVGVIPKWAAWLLFLGQLANQLNPTDIVLIQIAIFAAGFIWIGVHLLKLEIPDSEAVFAGDNSTAKTLFQLSGVSGLISVILLLILGIGSLVNFSLGQPLTILQFINFNLSAGIANIFFTFVLISIYFIQYKNLGWLGLAGFILTMIANVLFTAAQIMSSYASLNLDPLIEMLRGPGFIIGLLLLAIANHNSGTLPKWPFWLMFLGHYLNSNFGQIFSLFNQDPPDWPPTLPILLFAGGIAWLSIVLLRFQNLTTPSAESAAGKRRVSLKTLIRLAGMFAILGAVFNLTLGIGELFIESHTSPAYSVLSLIAGFAHIFFMYAFVAVYLRGYQELGWAGVVGFFLAITANSLFTIGQLITAYYGQLTGFPGFLTGPLFIIGLLLLAWANHKVGIVPKWAVWLLFLGQLANQLNSTDIVLIQIAIFAAGFIWIGVHLLKLEIPEVESLPVS